VIPTGRARVIASHASLTRNHSGAAIALAATIASHSAPVALRFARSRGRVRVVASGGPRWARRNAH
jgi:hypothetical protein